MKTNRSTNRLILALVLALAAGLAAAALSHSGRSPAPASECADPAVARIVVSAARESAAMPETEVPRIVVTARRPAALAAAMAARP